MTYRCSNCSRQFDEPKHIVEREIIDYGIGRQWVTLFEGNVCPYCENTNYVEVDENGEEI